MAVGMADLHRAIHSAWTTGGLDVIFKALWASSTSEFFVLNEQEAPGEQPFPYCVVDRNNSNTLVRMSGCGDKLQEVRDVEVVFNIHATEITGDIRSAKAIAAYLAEEVMKVFGGHPTTNPTGTVTLTNGHHLITTYQNDYNIVTEEGMCQWALVYNFRIDVPVAV